MEQKEAYEFSIILSVIISATIIITMFVINAPIISESLQNTEGGWNVVLIILIRIGILSGMAFYMFHKWFSQEEQYLTDIPFLFGMFFLILIFGKAVDLFWNLTFFSFNADLVLLLLRIRYFIIIFNLAPLVYLGIGILLYILSFRYSKLTKEYSNSLQLKLIALILGIEIFLVAIAPDIDFISIILPCILIPSLASIVYIFYFAYKNKRLSEVHPFILAIGFFLYMISTIIRPIAQRIIGESASYIVFVEIIDLMIFIVIFMGFYLHANYNQKPVELT